MIVSCLTLIIALEKLIFGNVNFFLILGLLIEKPKLEDLQSQVKSQANTISEKEEMIKNLQVIFHIKLNYL